MEKKRKRRRSTLTPDPERNEAELDRIIAEVNKGKRAWPAARKAGKETARYLPAAPAFWLEQCAALGMHILPGREGELSTIFSSIDPEAERAAFLIAWLLATPGGVDAVRAFLKSRE